MRMIIKWLVRLVLFPVILLLTILGWAGIYFTNFNGIVCKVVAGVVFLLTVIAWLIGIASAEQSAKTLMAGFALYLIPLVENSVIMCIARINPALTDIIQ